MDREIILAKGQALRKTFVAFFVNNKHIAMLALIGIVLGGMFSLKVMPIESEPEVKIPIGTITTIYPGASPADTEKLVTDELETALKNVDDIKEITSTSSEGVSVIVVEFEADADLDDSIRKLRDEIDTARSELPDGAEDPQVKQIRAGDHSILTFSIIGSAPQEEFRFFSEELEDLLEGISGVNEVEVRGLPDKEMQVLISKEKLEGFDLSITDIARTIAANHIDIPIGSIQTNDFYYQASLKAQFDAPEQLQELVIATKDGKSIFLRDIAIVRESFEATKSESRVFVAETGEYASAITIELYKKVGADLVRIVDNAKEIIEEFKEESLPSSMDIIIIEDFSEYIMEDIHRLLKSAWQTILIIAIILFLALGTRASIAAATSIPILYLISMVGLALSGETFNFLTFFALIISLGIVVDTSIVIIEGIYENMNEHDMDSENAALCSVAAFKSPLTAGTLTTVAAFLPLALMTGILGEYVKHIPITVNITLLASLFTALMLLPAFASKLLKRPGNKSTQKPPLLTPAFKWIGKQYGKNIHEIIHSKRRRRMWTLVMTLLFIGSGVLFATGIVKFQLFGSVDADYFIVEINAPDGSSLEKTKSITEEVEEYVKDVPELLQFVSVYGNGASHKSAISIRLVPKDDRKRTSNEISHELRTKIRRITSAEVLIREAEAGPPTGADIEARLTGKNVEELEVFAQIIQRELEQIEGTEDVTNDLELSPGEFHLLPKRDRLEYFGMNAQDVGLALRTSVFGDDSVKIKRGGDETPIVVKMDFRDKACTGDRIKTLIEHKESITLCRSHPEDISDLQNLLIQTRAGEVPLSEMFSVELHPAITTIRHHSTHRAVTVKSGVQEGFIINDVLLALQERIEEIDMPRGITISFGGENEDTEESMASLGRASVIALLLIFTILVYQFGSFKHVFIIFATMPLAIMGVLYGLAVLRIPLSFPGMIGIVALLGIVVNDAIVLIDKINNNRKFNLPLPDAIEQGCKQRLQPVIITTMTTALGMIPLIFSGNTFRDLAIVVAVGITVATVFTLVMVPIFYMALESRPLAKLFTFIKGRIRG
jgi:multidrug efflux pump subunit AcrB